MLGGAARFLSPVGDADALSARLEAFVHVPPEDKNAPDEVLMKRVLGRLTVPPVPK